MHRSVFSPLYAAMALAVFATPSFAMADEGGGGGASSMVDLPTALGLLNPETDTDWNRGGQPSVERLQALTGDVKLTRAQIVAAAPDLDRERAPKIAKSEPAKVETPTPAPAGDAGMPDWAKKLLERVDEQDRTIAELGERNEALTNQLSDAEDRADRASSHVADDVLDGDLPPQLRGLDPADPNSGKRPPAAPTPLAMTTATGDSAGINSLVPAREPQVHNRLTRRWPGGPGKPLVDVEVVAIAVGQYPAQPGKLRRVGERFTFSGVPGTWFVPANHVDLEKYLTGELTTEDAAKHWGLRAEMSADLY